MLSGVKDREIDEGVYSDRRLPQAEKRQGGVRAEGGGGGGTGSAKLVMGMPYFLDDHGAVVIGFEFGIKGNTKVDETIDYIDGVVRESGERFVKVPSKVHMVGTDTLMVEVSKKIMIPYIVTLRRRKINKKGFSDQSHPSPPYSHSIICNGLCCLLALF